MPAHNGRFDGCRIEAPAAAAAIGGPGSGGRGSDISKSFSLRRLLGFIGPGYLIAVGYLDPGNWATDLAGGSSFGYALLWIVVLSSLMAMFLQVLAARLGVVSGLDLAQACRAHSRPGSIVWQWLLCEVAICAADLAEVIGTAIALQLLFGLPLVAGVALTAFDVLLLLWLQRRGYRWLEALMISLVGIVLACVVLTLVMAQPAWHDVFAGLLPTARTVADPGMLYVAIGIVGATVMPHNLYLHSAIVKQRAASADSRSAVLAYTTVDTVLALSFALVINAAILIMAGAAFHATGHRAVAELQDAHALLSATGAGALGGGAFALALLASGQSSSISATLAGQIVMEGYLRLRVSVWLRRILTRSVAVVPALVVTVMYGEAGIGKLLIASQVLLSLQLPFAVVPLIRYTSRRDVMGSAANGQTTKLLAIVVAALIIALNLVLVWRAMT